MGYAHRSLSGDRPGSQHLQHKRKGGSHAATGLHFDSSRGACSTRLIWQQFCTQRPARVLSLTKSCACSLVPANDMLGGILRTNLGRYKTCRSNNEDFESLEQTVGCYIEYPFPSSQNLGGTEYLFICSSNGMLIIHIVYFVVRILKIRKKDKNKSEFHFIKIHYVISHQYDGTANKS